tara:strand:+ start:1326 stop:1619 length:294 start_codon:yes stop_codon:yes gene_type:complete
LCKRGKSIGTPNEINPKLLLFIIKNKIEKRIISGLINVATAKKIEEIIGFFLLTIDNNMNKSDNVSDTPNKYKLRTLSKTRNKTNKIGNISYLFEIL